MFEKAFPKNHFISLFWIIIGFCIGFLFPLFFYLLKVNPSYFKPLLFFTCSILFYFSTFRQNKFEHLLTDITLGILLFLCCYLVYTLALTFLHIPQWDFISFYLFGKVGISKENFYDPHVFMNFYNELNLRAKVDVGFIPEIVNVGFWYPPPSMFLFLPLGMFDLKTGYLIWQTFIVLFLIADVFLLAKYYRVNISKIYNKNITIYFSLILILLFPSITSAITYSQTISVFLFFLILLIQHLNNWKAGTFLAILVMIKPLAIILLLYFIIYKKWKIIQSFAIMGLIILIISFAFFGYSAFANYFISPPTSRIPDNLFYEDTIESLNGILLRLQLRFFGYANFKSAKILTFVLSILITIITIFSSKNLARKAGIFSFLVFLPMMLLIYPNTQDFYIPILLPALLYLLIQKRFRHNIFNIMLLFVLYGIGYYSLFLLSLFLWIILMLWAFSDKYIGARFHYGFSMRAVNKLELLEKNWFNF